MRSIPPILNISPMQSHPMLNSSFSTLSIRAIRPIQYCFATSSFLNHKTRYKRYLALNAKTGWQIQGIYSEKYIARPTAAAPSHFKCFHRLRTCI
jgi:hypothetical protein